MAHSSAVGAGGAATDAGVRSDVARGGPEYVVCGGCARCGCDADLTTGTCFLGSSVSKLTGDALEGVGALVLRSLELVRGTSKPA